jgi:uncharacterized membrane protein
MNWELLLRDGTIAILFITIAAFGATVYLIVIGQPVPEWLRILDASLLTFWSGMGVGQLRARVQQAECDEETCDCR